MRALIVLVVARVLVYLFRLLFRVPVLLKDCSIFRFMAHFSWFSRVSLAWSLRPHVSRVGRNSLAWRVVSNYASPPVCIHLQSPAFCCLWVCCHPSRVLDILWYSRRTQDVVGGTRFQCGLADGLAC